MRKMVVLFVTIAVLSGSTISCQGSSGGAPTSTPKKKTYSITPRKNQNDPQRFRAQEQTAAQKKKEEELKRKRALTKKKKMALNDTKWDIELMLSSDTVSKQRDVIIFSEKKVYTENLIKENFLPTNYTITIEDGGKIIWETMQSNGNETIFIRGELDSTLKKMKGIMSQQRLEGTRDYSFVTIEKEQYIPEQVQKETQQSQEIVETVQ